MLDVRCLRLIAITDDLRDGGDGLASRAAAAVRGGATMVQVRLRDVAPRELVAITRTLVARLSVPVIVSDRADVAVAAGAAGVHLAVDELPAAALRPLVPPGFIIGASVGSDGEVADASEADYVGIGPVFPSSSRPDAADAMGADAFSRLAALVARPAVAIGGITASNCRRAIDAGGSGVAVIRAIFAAPDPEVAARELWSAIGS